MDIFVSRILLPSYYTIRPCPCLLFSPTITVAVFLTPTLPKQSFPNISRSHPTKKHSFAILPIYPLLPLNPHPIHSKKSLYNHSPLTQSITNKTHAWTVTLIQAWVFIILRYSSYCLVEATPGHNLLRHLSYGLPCHFAVVTRFKQYRL